MVQCIGKSFISILFLVDPAAPRAAKHGKKNGEEER
jgi:hypothetical protein